MVPYTHKPCNNIPVICTFIISRSSYFQQQNNYGYDKNHVRLAKKCMEVGTSSHHWVDVMKKYQCIAFFIIIRVESVITTCVSCPYKNMFYSDKLCALLLQIYLIQTYPPIVGLYQPKTLLISSSLPRYRRIAGYTVRLSDFKMFPEDKCTAPEKNHISLMAAEPELLL